MGFLFYRHEVLQVECVIVKYKDTGTRINTSVTNTYLTHVNFNHVYKVEARYKVSKVLRLNVKLSEFLLLRLRATFHTLPLFYLRT